MSKANTKTNTNKTVATSDKTVNTKPAAKNTKTEKSIKDIPVETPVVKAPAVAETPVAEKPVDETPVDETPDENLDKKSLAKKRTIPTFKFEGDVDDIDKQVEEMWQDMEDMQKEVNAKFTLYKHFLRDIKKKFIASRKIEDKIKSKKENRKSRNYLSPVFKISPELAEFMGVDQEKGACRTSALGFISKYVKENGLNKGIEVKDAEGVSKLDKRMIDLDEKLSKLFPNLVNSDEHLMFTSILTNLAKNNHIGEKMGTQTETST
jgi:chromatin remodeling complex protein RSC6